MIRTFADAETERIWNRDRSRKLPGEIQQRAMRRLTLIDSATSLTELGNLPATASIHSRTIARVSTLFHAMAYMLRLEVRRRI